MEHTSILTPRRQGKTKAQLVAMATELSALKQENQRLREACTDAIGVLQDLRTIRAIEILEQALKSSSEAMLPSNSSGGES